MRVVKRKPLIEFSKRWPAAAGPLTDWYQLTMRAVWRNFPDVVRTFGQTDLARVGSEQTVCIFDIGGNKFRLVARIRFNKQKLYVLRVLTHKEYDKKKWMVQL